MSKTSKNWQELLYNDVDLPGAYRALNSESIGFKREFLKAKIAHDLLDVDLSKVHLEVSKTLLFSNIENDVDLTIRKLLINQLEIENATFLFNVGDPHGTAKEFIRIETELKAIDVGMTQAVELKKYALAFIALFSGRYSEALVVGKSLVEDSIRVSDFNQSNYLLGCSLASYNLGSKSDALEYLMKAFKKSELIELNYSRAMNWLLVKYAAEVLGYGLGASLWESKVKSLKIHQDSLSTIRHLTSALKTAFQLSAKYKIG